jgi:alanine racemase
VVVGVGSLHGLPSLLAGRMSVVTPGGARGLNRIDEFESVVESWPGAAPDNKVIVFGAGGASATDLAETIETVGEEILVRVSPTVPREAV